MSVQFARPTAAYGRPLEAPKEIFAVGNRWESIVRLLDCSMLAAGLGLVLVAGLGLVGLTSTLVGALHVGSERLRAGFDALSGVSHARAPEELADSYYPLRTSYDFL